MTTAIITGTSKGLGAALTKQLLSKGFNIVGTSRTKSSINTKNFYQILGEISDEKTVQKAFSKADSLGDLKLVISCAGRGVFGAVGTNVQNNIEEALKGNLIGTILVSEHAVNAFKKDGGKIINIMSTAANVARKNESIYCASKWGAKGYTESLRLELKGSNTSVVAIYPGGMNTPFWKNAINSEVNCANFMDSDDVAERIVDAVLNDDSSYVSDLIINRK